MGSVQGYSLCHVQVIFSAVGGGDGEGDGDGDGEGVGVGDGDGDGLGAGAAHAATSGITNISAK